MHGGPKSVAVLSLVVATSGFVALVASRSSRVPGSGDAAAACREVRTAAYILHRSPASPSLPSVVRRHLKAAAGVASEAAIDDVRWRTLAKVTSDLSGAQRSSALDVSVGAQCVGLAGTAARPVVTTMVGPHVAPTPSSSTNPKSPAETVVLGHSVQGHPITAVHLGVAGSANRVVVVGCIHGNEPAGIAIARQLETMAAGRSLDLWIVEDLNPDGVAAGTRQNADGVDLNRNFPYRWLKSGHRGDQQYPGPAALSEPESRTAYDLLTRVRPTLTVWFHQPLGLVDDSGGDKGVEQRYAQGVGLPFHRLSRYPGSATGWQNAELAPTTAFVVELPPGPLSPRAASRHAQAILDLVS